MLGMHVLGCGSRLLEPRHRYPPHLCDDGVRPQLLQLLAVDRVEAGARGQRCPDLPVHVSRVGPPRLGGGERRQVLQARGVVALVAPAHQLRGGPIVTLIDDKLNDFGRRRQQRDNL